MKQTQMIVRYDRSMLSRNINLCKLSTKTLLVALSALLILIQTVECSTAVEENSHENNNETLTACMHLRSFESRRAKSLGREGRNVRIPRCSQTGNFEPIQCTNELSNTDCWCVDEYGVEIAGTRKSDEQDVNCAVIQSPCPASSCRMYCPGGFARDARSGCSVCRCRDSCDGIKCPNGQACEQVEVKCSAEPCPPVPSCRKARSLNEMCPAGSPLSIQGTPRPFLCGNDPGKPSCPPLYKCLVQGNNDYGVCCPASLKFEKPGNCPRPDEILSTLSTGPLCGGVCSHDLECPSMQKCCDSKTCGRNCQQPKDVTVCHQARLVSELLSVNEREGRGYVPQCNSTTGVFAPKQCSNNGLVCWCVDPASGNKIKGTMGAAKSVTCENIANLIARSGARSIDGQNNCDLNICAAVCQYGFKNDHNGCSTCECSEPCEGFNCKAGYHCEVARDPSCLSDSGLCLSEPVCKPDIVYSNPCEIGSPLVHNLTNEILFCNEDRVPSPEYQSRSFFDSEEETESRAMSKKIDCPTNFKCKKLHGQSESVCCPLQDDSIGSSAEIVEHQIAEKQQSMCEYLRDFSERMEGTEDGMSLALNSPKCNIDGSYSSMQCQIKKITVTKAEQKKVLEQNNVRMMRKLLSRNRRSEKTGGSLKLIRIEDRSDDNEEDVQISERDLKGINAQTIVDYLRHRLNTSPQGFLSELFGDQSMSRSSKAFDISADIDDEEKIVPKNSRVSRKIVKTSHAPINEQTQQIKAEGHIEVDVEECWCVDSFGTEIPKSRGSNVTDPQCDQLRENLECLDLTCRMGCDYGFILDPDTRCPSCECRDPCDGVVCPESQECRTVEVSCEGEYCPPVPACFHRKPGQCPFLVPPSSEDSDTCDYECRSDSHCTGNKRCCSNGCGTTCVDPELKTACQHLQSIQLHQAIELGVPAKQKYIAQCSTSDGSWNTVQCGPGNVCWCVDEYGNEKSGTKTISRTPNCEVKQEVECPLYKCSPCEHGHLVDSNGCKTCECRDPCKEISCPRDELCQLVQVECTTLPCPKMPICVPLRDSICTEGLPLKLNGREINCGPDADGCPTTHSCNLNPISNRGVCCAKSRDVCFESIDSNCLSHEDARNDIESVIKWRFSPRQNKCVPVSITKSKSSTCTNKNLFHNELACNSVCPVLTQCERLKLKNEIAQRRRGQSEIDNFSFLPKCDSTTGFWSSIQCIGNNSTESVCWCADKKGSPIKGSLTKGAEPVCNHRQARRRMSSSDESNDPVMEELIRQISFLTDENNFEDGLDEEVAEATLPTERIIEISENLIYGESTKKLIASTTRCDSLRSSATFDVACDEKGMFVPTQCNLETCWCVDEAGNQLPFTSTFRRNSKSCSPTQIDAVEVELYLTNPNQLTMRNLYDVLHKELDQLLEGNYANFRVQENGDGTALLRFDLIEDNKVNLAFAIEEMSRDENLFLFHGMLRPDVTQSKFSHKVQMSSPDAQKFGIPQNTFHTIIFILTTSSAFMISIFVIYVMLKRGRSKSKIYNNKSMGIGPDKCLDFSSPIFVLNAEDIPEVKRTRSIKKIVVPIQNP